MVRKGDFIKTHTGLNMYPLDPRPEEISLEDIAHALSNTCRFTGHTSEFYSVATHSVLVSVYASDENAMWGLLHDASEAYLCDIARPVKRNDLLNGYREAEERLMKCIAEKFNLSWPMPEEIKILDNRFLMAEARDLGIDTSDWSETIEPMPSKIYPQLPAAAKQSFYDWYNVITQKIKETL